MDKGALLDRLGLTGEDRIALARVLDRAEQAQRRNIPAATDFLSPQQQAQALDAGAVLVLNPVPQHLHGIAHFLHCICLCPCLDQQRFRHQMQIISVSSQINMPCESRIHTL